MLKIFSDFNRLFSWNRPKWNISIEGKIMSPILTKTSAGNFIAMQIRDLRNFDPLLIKFYGVLSPEEITKIWDRTGIFREREERKNSNQRLIQQLIVGDRSWESNPSLETVSKITSAYQERGYVPLSEMGYKF
ncbi:MAG: hypothetical protein V1788_02890 [Nanoarchaeota archaeon]